MHLALLTTFAASRKEPLASVLERVHAGIITAGFGEPSVRFTFSEGPITRISSVGRVLKRLPLLERFAQSLAPCHGAPQMRVLSNRTSSGAIGETVDFTDLLEIARGVPRIFPFHNVVLIFSVPVFSGGVTLNSAIQGGQLPGITVTDSWWVNARQRSLTALTIGEAEPAAKKVPAPPASLTAAFAACGKMKKTVQVPLVIGTSSRPTLDTASPEVAQAIRAVVRDYRTRMAEIIDRAQLPNDLPPNQEAAATEPVGVTAGPKKPELVRAFVPMGYDCRGESGTFTRQRRTPGNLTAELLLDVGTWFHSVTAIFRVQGLVNDIGFKATLILPVARRAVVGSQYNIGAPDQWRQIVDNLAALVAELDRSFVPAIEVASGPSPDWYRPESSTIEQD